MATKTEILSQAEQIRTNNTANSNTPALVGGAIKDLITYVGDKTAAEISFAKGGTELESTNVQGALLELYNRVVTAMARAVSAVALAGTNTEELGALDRTVKKHTIAITNLQSALATDETDIDTLQAQVGSISSSLVTMSADIVRAMDKAKAAYNMADNHEDIIPGLDAGIKNNLSKINKNIADISELAGKIAINVRDIAALVSKDSIHDADIASLQTYTSTIDTTFKAFKSTVEQWEAAATSLHNTLSADVNTLKTDVANLKSKKVGNGVQAQSDDIASEAITGPKLASNSVTTGKIAPNTILDNDINPSSFDDNLATSRKLADAKIVGDKLAGKVDKETGMSLIKSTAADALKFAKKNSSGNLDLEEYNDVCVSSLRFRDVHGDSKDLANLLENQNTKVGDLETKIDSFHEIVEDSDYKKADVDLEGKIYSAITVDDKRKEYLETDFVNGLKSNGEDVLTQQDIEGKVDKIEGKKLSTNDYTDADKEKVSKIEEIKTKCESVFGFEENEEYVCACVDSEGKIYSAITADGNRKEFLPTEYTDSLKVGGKNVLTDLPSKEIQDDSIGQNSEFVSVTIDAGGKIVNGITRDGVSFFGAIDSPTIDDINKSIKDVDGSIPTDSHIASIVKNVLVEKLPPYEYKAGNLNDGDKILINHNHIKANKTIQFSCSVGTFQSVIVGCGSNKNGYGNNWFTISETNVIAHTYLTSETRKEFAHSVPIGEKLSIDINYNSRGYMYITIESMGTAQTIETNIHGGTSGEVFAESAGSVLNDCKLIVASKEYNNSIHFYGDSYFGLTSDNAWTYYLAEDGAADKVLLDGYAGKAAELGYKTFSLNIQHGVPKYAVWCLGMNNPDSTLDNPAANPNSSWLTNVQKFIQLCESKSIIPILSTIPSVYGGYSADSGISQTRYNKAKNDWVKASGYRYIDFAKAVGASDSTGLWYNNGLANDMLEGDATPGVTTMRVHPTKYGAIALYQQVKIDFPEILTL